MIIQPIKTDIFQEGQDLFAFITKYCKKLPEKSVLVITSKIVALDEKQTAIIKNDKDKEKLIRQESEWAIPTKHVWLTIKNGVVMAAAGIDESNANGKVILLPKDSFKQAQLLRNRLKQKYQIKNLGVLITDSRTMPLRSGVTGVALGYAGFKGIRDYRGLPDIFGKKFKFSQTNIADSLATAAVLVMGEGKEQHPLAIIKNPPIEFHNKKTDQKELHIDVKDDMYYPLFSKSIKS